MLSKLIQGVLVFILTAALVIGLIAAGVWLDRKFLKQPTIQTAQPNPPLPWNTATVYPTVNVQELPFGMNSKSPIQAARTRVPTEIPLSALFAFSQEKANTYWTGFRPGYQFSFINTAGSQRVRQGTAHESVSFWSWEVPGTRLEVGATIDVGIIVGFTRNAITKSITDIEVIDKLIKVRVELPSECAIMVAVPIVNDLNPTPMPDIELERVQLPAWWQPSALMYLYNETALNQKAVGEGTILALTALLEEDVLHQYHVSSILTEEGYQTAGLQEPARDTIEDIVREAICWKMSKSGRVCDPTKIEVELVAAPPPDRLLRCGSGHPILDVPYASKHIDLTVTTPTLAPP